jgi:hypothetical protein
MCRRPAVSTISVSQAMLRASRRASLASRRHQRLPGRLAFLVAFVELGVDGFGDDLELFARGRTVDVDRNQHWPVTALFEPRGQLAGGGGFAGALQAGHQNHRGRLRGEFEARRVLAQDGDQLVADDLDDLLGGRERRQHLGAHGLDADLLDQVVDHVEVNVGFEQRHADFAQRFGDVLFGKRALAAKGLEGALQLISQILKHEFPKVFGNLLVYRGHRFSLRGGFREEDRG